MTRCGRETSGIARKEMKKTFNNMEMMILRTKVTRLRPTLTVEELEEVDRLAGYEEISRSIKCKFYVNQAQKNARKVSLCRPGQCMTGDTEVVNGAGDVVL